MRQILLPPNTFALCVVSMFFLPGPLLHHPLRWGGALLVLAGFALIAWAQQPYRTNDSEINTFKTPRGLVTSGPFQYTRNPMYLGFAVALAGCAWVAATPWALLPWVVFVALCAGWYIPFEEAAAEDAFGDPYVRYKARVSRWVGRRA